ncbi:hypothetical protein ABZV77_11600 [Streptomyces sp. NPDC004732]|uniref:collagen-like triple helix repeat-containing protein n=1 Tax=Streptomyces sp. NPDC004732 TaxID=3154290 RepID=UPI0033BEC7C6
MANINFTNGAKYPASNFRRMFGSLQDFAKGFDDLKSFAVPEGSDSQRFVVIQPGRAWIKADEGKGSQGVFWVESQEEMRIQLGAGEGLLYLTVVGPEFDSKFTAPELRLAATIDINQSALPERAIALAEYRRTSETTYALRDVRFDPAYSQFLITRTGPGGLGAPVEAMLAVFRPGTQYTDIATGSRWVKRENGSWLRDGNSIFQSGDAPDETAGHVGDLHIRTHTEDNPLAPGAAWHELYVRTPEGWDNTGSLRANKWLAGAGEPQDEYGSDGDLYASGDGNGNIFQKVSGEWVSLGSIRGPMGPQGVQGPQGSRGATGATGAKGDKGEPGNDGKDGTGLEGGNLNVNGDTSLNGVHIAGNVVAQGTLTLGAYDVGATLGDLNSKTATLSTKIDSVQQSVGTDIQNKVKDLQSKLDALTTRVDKVEKMPKYYQPRAGAVRFAKNSETLHVMWAAKESGGAVIRGIGVKGTQNLPTSAGTESCGDEVEIKETGKYRVLLGIGMDRMSGTATTKTEWSNSAELMVKRAGSTTLTQLKHSNAGSSTRTVYKVSLQAIRWEGNLNKGDKLVARAWSGLLGVNIAAAGASREGTYFSVEKVA